MKLAWETDEEVSDAAVASESVVHAIELERGHLPGTNQNDDAIGQPGGPSECLPLERSIPRLELQLDLGGACQADGL